MIASASRTRGSMATIRKGPGVAAAGRTPTWLAARGESGPRGDSEIDTVPLGSMPDQATVLIESSHAGDSPSETTNLFRSTPASEKNLESAPVAEPVSWREAPRRYGSRPGFEVDQSAKKTFLPRGGVERTRQREVRVPSRTRENPTSNFLERSRFSSQPPFCQTTSVLRGHFRSGLRARQWTACGLAPE